MGVIQIIIADDHVMFREALKYMLESEKQFQVIAEAGNGNECLEKLAVQKPNLLILDLFMPIKDGIDVLKKIRESNQNRNLKILVLTGCTKIDYLWKVLALDVQGYLLKSSSFIELKKAINTVMEGEKYIQPDWVKKFDSRKMQAINESEQWDRLTKRELEVLENLSMGMYNKEIAIKLEISERTVKNHVSNIFKKIGVADRTQAAIYAIRNGLINLND